MDEMDRCDEVRRATARYREPWRAYHDELHLDELKRHLLQAEHDGAGVVDGVAAYGFVVWHDAVYDPQAAPGRNEALSAQLCRSELATFAQPASVERACQAILATVRHELPVVDPSPDVALLLDCDLAILGAEPSRFAAYDAAIRQEYAHVPEMVFAVRRAEVLAAFLRRPRLYLTGWAEVRWEARARENLAPGAGR
jgi:predicted metal-dependent HD superfamily phosphohydrolase